MSWKEIVGHNKVRELLISLYKRNKLTHSYIFLGPQGIGKRRVALEFSKLISCLNPLQGENSCEFCKSCLLFSHSLHPDIKIIEPHEGTIKISQTKIIQDEVMFRPRLSQRKIFILDNADTLTPEAANNLLKLLEEPPDFVLFILILVNQEALPNTIISRCQVIKFTPIPLKTIEKYLEEKLGFPHNEAICFASSSGGIFSFLEELIRGSKEVQLREKSFLFFKRLFSNDLWNVNVKGNIVSIEAITGEPLLFSCNKEDLDVVADYLLSFCRDLLLFNLTRRASLLLNADKEGELSKLKFNVSPQNEFNIYQKLCMLKDALYEKVNTRLALENFLYS